jgi:AMP-binding enzyme
MVNYKINPSHIVRGPNKDVEQFPDTDIYSFMFRREEVGNFPPAQDPDRIAFIDAPSGQQITFRQLKNRIESLSRGFNKALNLKAGDVVCFHMPNHVVQMTAALTS